MSLGRDSPCPFLTAQPPCSTPFLTAQPPRSLATQDESRMEQSMILTSSGSLGSQLAGHWGWLLGTPHTPVLG